MMDDRFCIENAEMAEDECVLVFWEIDMLRIMDWMKLRFLVV